MAIDYLKGLSDNPIIQVVSAETTTQSSTTSSTFQNGLSLGINPHHSSNKIIVMGSACISMGGGSTMGGIIRILRSDGQGTSVNVTGTGNYGHYFSGATNYDMDIAGNGFIYLDSPNTTNSLTYYQQFRTEHHHVYYNQKKYANRPGKASFVLMEIMA